MPREFVDSLNFISESHLNSCILIANQLGFSELWISNPPKGIKKNIKAFTDSSSIRIYTRLDIGMKNESKEQITTILRHRRRTVPIIAVTCLTPEITAWAAQDNRVDIIKFPILQIGKLMTRSVAKLMVKFEKNLEIALSDLYNLPERQQIAAIRQIRFALGIAKKKGVPIIFSSGSSKAKQLRSPQELISLSQVLLEESTLPLDSLSKIPNNLLKQNLLKISPNYILPGVFKVEDQLRFPLSQMKEEEE
ncbi:MAG: RNase P subunit p30 family protein [Candidatus Hodarchaeota archaeon]